MSIERRLLRGTGPDLGATVQRFPVEHRTLLHVLHRQVRERADHDWLVFDGSARLSFADAQAQVYRFAAAVQADGLAGSHVALLLRNQLEFMPAFLGVQAAGGVSIPLNPELRGPLLSTMLGRCQARVLVVAADLLDRLDELDSLAGVELVIVGSGVPRPLAAHPNLPVVGFDDWLDGHLPTPPERFPDSSDLACLMFTSGTSGGSKAAAWSHHYLYLGGACMCDSMGHGPDSVLSTPLQMCHIAGLQNFATSALHAGCTAHLKSRFSASRYWEEIATDRATFSMLMGPMAAMILRTTESAPEHCLQRVYILPQPAERIEFERRYRTTVVWQGWGMTEIFPHTPQFQRLDDVPADAIGPAPAWVDFGVVDENDRMVEPGVLGQLVYRPLIPDGMASGYFGDPAATTAAFRNLMFHTGDLGYYDEQGYMHFVMRNQDAIRRRGENVSAVELENIALGHPQVIEAAAYAVASELGEHDVKLDVVCEGELSLANLHEWLQARLPRFMYPSYLQRREALPRTPSQRVEKYKLAAEPVSAPGVFHYVAPRASSDRSRSAAI